MSAEVVKFKPVGGDIVAGLRALADRIERGEEDEVKFVIAASVTGTDRFRAYSWGRCSNLEAMGAFAMVVANSLVDERSEGGNYDDAS